MEKIKLIRQDWLEQQNYILDKSLLFERGYNQCKTDILCTAKELDWDTFQKEFINFVRSNGGNQNPDETLAFIKQKLSV